MSDPGTAPHPHPKTIRFSWAQIILSVIALVAAIAIGLVNLYKPSGATSTVNGQISHGGVGVNNGTINNNFQQPSNPPPAVTVAPPPTVIPPAAVAVLTPAPSLTSKQKDAKLAAWRKLNRQMEDFSAILQRGDDALDGWLTALQADPPGEAAKVRQFSEDVHKIRLALESNFNTMAGDQAEVGELVKEARRPPGAEHGPSISIFALSSRAADALANEMLSAQTYDRQNLEDRLSSTIQALREHLDTLKKRRDAWASTAQKQIKELSN